jgi:hypothetical protein
MDWTPKQCHDLVNAVGSYLEFQALCHRTELFSEKYLSQPIGEFLMQAHSGSLVAEHGHQLLNQNGMARRGRPNQVDFALISRDTRDVESVLETKWVIDRAYSKYEIFADLLRLECFREHGRHVRRFFLVAGTRTNFRKHFRKLQSNDEGARSPFTIRLLSFKSDQPKKNVTIYDSSAIIRKLAQKYSEMHHDCEVPRGMHTILRAERLKPFRVALWEVQSRRNRTTFSLDA